MTPDGSGEARMMKPEKKPLRSIIEGFLLGSASFAFLFACLIGLFLLSSVLSSLSQ